MAYNIDLLFTLELIPANICSNRRKSGTQIDTTTGYILLLF